MDTTRVIGRLLKLAQARDMPADFIAFLWETHGASPLEREARLGWLETMLAESLAPTSGTHPARLASVTTLHAV